MSCILRYTWTVVTARSVGPPKSSAEVSLTAVSVVARAPHTRTNKAHCRMIPTKYSERSIARPTLPLHPRHAPAHLNTPRTSHRLVASAHPPRPPLLLFSSSQAWDTDSRIRSYGSHWLFSLNQTAVVFSVIADLLILLLCTHSLRSVPFLRAIRISHHYTHLCQSAKLTPIIITPPPPPPPALRVLPLNLYLSNIP